MLVEALVQHDSLTASRRHDDGDVHFPRDVEAGQLHECVGVVEADAAQLLALLSVEAGRARAHVLVRVARLVALASVLAVVALTRARLRVLDGSLWRHLAVPTLEAAHALTRVAVDAVHAPAVVLTQVRAAVVDVQLTVVTSVARPTVTPAQ